MLESIYISLIILGFITFIVSFFTTKEEKFIRTIILLGVSSILFGALAAGSANVEVATCTSTQCTTSSFIFTENMYIFGFFTLISTILALIKSFDAFYFTKGAL